MRQRSFPFLPFFSRHVRPLLALGIDTFGNKIINKTDELYACFISDVTPPSTQNCPASFSDQSNSLQKQVTWTPPTFTDNVGVASVLSNRQPGFLMDTYTSIAIQYTATDAAGNIAYCRFNITLEGTCSRAGWSPFSIQSEPFDNRYSAVRCLMVRSVTSKFLPVYSTSHVVYRSHITSSSKS